MSRLSFSQLGCLRVTLRLWERNPAHFFTGLVLDDPGRDSVSHTLGAPKCLGLDLRPRFLFFSHNPEPIRPRDSHV